MNERAMFIDDEYRKWLGELKSRIRTVQLKAAISVNEELLGFYWELGADIVQKQSLTQWGEGFLKQLCADLISEFPGMKGFSRRQSEMRHLIIENDRQTVIQLIK